MEKSKRPSEPIQATSIDAVVDYCKENGLMLHVSDARFDRKLLEDGLQLCHAVAAPVGSWAAASDPQIYGEPCPLRVSKSLLDEMDRRLQDDDLDVISKIAAKPVERTFVYFDVSDFSKQPSGHQAIIINTLTSLGGKSGEWTLACEDPRREQERSLCIGDGYIFAFRHAAPAVRFAGFLADRIYLGVAQGEIIEFHFRSGVHTGPVYRFWDGSDWNYVGQGINDARRILEAVGRNQDDVVFISDETRTQVTRHHAGSGADFLDPSIGFLQNRGRRQDKHGGYHRVYELNHRGWIAEFK
jgi:hypothetical protein